MAMIATTTINSIKLKPWFDALIKRPGPVCCPDNIGTPGRALSSFGRNALAQTGRRVVWDADAPALADYII
jgi:hypothetical protein